MLFAFRCVILYSTIPNEKTKLMKKDSGYCRLILCTLSFLCGLQVGSSAAFLLVSFLYGSKCKEPWSSGYRRRLASKRSWVQIPVPDTGWTFFHIFGCKNCLFEKTENKRPIFKKRLPMSRFLLRYVGVAIKCSANCTATTSHRFIHPFYVIQFDM